MFGPKELDLMNVYNPDLQNIRESAERTYGEANSFYRKEDLYLKDIGNRILSGELSSERDIYDECHAIASDLAKCCEMYLKALYIYEHNIPGYKIDDLWEKLKNSVFKMDEKGNLVYKTSSGEITFIKYDEQGDPIKDADGKIIYFDKNDNIYNENNRGSKIKINGHQLDRLIELLSAESRLLLETRMQTIPMGTTEENGSISFLDILLEKGVLLREKYISSEQYVGWLEQHKRTFEEARYSGQKKYDVNLEFLYHLTTQIKAVVQYRMDPRNEQKFTVTDKELAQVPSEIKEKVSSYSQLLSEDLIKLIANDEEIKNKFVNLFSGPFIMAYKNVSAFNFFNVIKLFDDEEIMCLSIICCVIINYDIINKETFSEISDIAKKSTEIAGIFKSNNVSLNYVVDLFLQIKDIRGKGLYLEDNDIIILLMVLKNVIFKETSDENNVMQDFMDENNNKKTKKRLKIFDRMKSRRVDN